MTTTTTTAKLGYRDLVNMALAAGGSLRVRASDCISGIDAYFDRADVAFSESQRGEEQTFINSKEVWSITIVMDTKSYPRLKRHEFQRIADGSEPLTEILTRRLEIMAGIQPLHVRNISHHVTKEEHEKRLREAAKNMVKPWPAAAPSSGVRRPPCPNCDGHGQYVANGLVPGTQWGTRMTYQCEMCNGSGVC